MPTTIIALHYWAGSGAEFGPVRDLLPEAEIIAPDLPGFGQQPVPPGFDYSVAAYITWLVRYIEHRQVHDFILLGHSMGGKIALALAAHRPEGLRGLLLLSPSPPTPEPISDQDRAASLAAYGKLPEAEKTLEKITERALAPEWRARVVADSLLSSKPAWDAWLEGGSREDISGQMDALNVPCHLLVGEADRAIAPATQRRQTLPLLPAGTGFTVVPGAGHLLPLEAPQVVAETLKKLL